MWVAFRQRRLLGHSAEVAFLGTCLELPLGSFQG